MNVPEYYDPLPDSPEARALQEIYRQINDLTAIVENEGMLLRERIELEGKIRSSSWEFFLGAVVGLIVVALLA